MKETTRSNNLKIAAEEKRIDTLRTSIGRVYMKNCESCKQPMYNIYFTRRFCHSPDCKVQKS